ncbi:hypothetical protein CKAN_02092000 [Cinnamomum micranthum f. kanehirae]|uniref:Uncharacterized protein n=1 Tax=Cinnamomum micranthum f. kanehirae TaxID=337451 RepID=A0A443PLW2_9MAGN|nr:hypothetical protein CKAN_02092000 [Cinnamomum micranthum f. kanehirae]
MYQKHFETLLSSPSQALSQLTKPPTPISLCPPPASLSRPFTRHRPRRHVCQPQSLSRTSLSYDRPPGHDPGCLFVSPSIPSSPFRTSLSLSQPQARDIEVVQFIWMDEIATEYIPNPNLERGQNDIRMEEIKASLQEIKQAMR